TAGRATLRPGQICRSSPSWRPPSQADFSPLSPCRQVWPAQMRRGTNSAAGSAHRSAQVAAGRLRQYFLFDVAKLVLAEEHLVVDEECGRAERAARNRLLGELHQTGLGLGLLRLRRNTLGIDAGRT